MQKILLLSLTKQFLDRARQNSPLLLVQIGCKNSPVHIGLKRKREFRNLNLKSLKRNCKFRNENSKRFKRKHKFRNQKLKIVQRNYEVIA